MMQNCKTRLRPFLGAGHAHLYCRARRRRRDAADQLGITFAKTLITMNAGAILALLTIIGGAKEQSLFTFEVSSLQWAMGLFLAGVVLILIALLISYVFYAHPSESKAHQFFDRNIIKINGALAVISLFCFAGGVIFLLKNIMTA